MVSRATRAPHPRLPRQEVLLKILHVIDNDTGEVMLSVPCAHECVQSMLHFIEEFAAKAGQAKPPLLT